MTLRSRVVDGLFDVLELFAATYDLVRKLQRKVRRDTDPIPLVYKNGAVANDTLTQPIPKAPRVPKI